MHDASLLHSSLIYSRLHIDLSCWLQLCTNGPDIWYEGLHACKSSIFRGHGIISLFHIWLPKLSVIVPVNLDADITSNPLEIYAECWLEPLIFSESGVKG